MLLGRLYAGVPEQFADFLHRDARCQPTASGGVSQTMRCEVRLLSESRPEESAEVVLPVCYGDVYKRQISERWRRLRDTCATL